MAKYTDIKQRIEAAKTTADHAELREMASHPFVYVKAGVAENPNASKEILLLLVHGMKQPLEDDDYQVGGALMRRTDLMPEVAAAFCAVLMPSLQSIEPRDFWELHCWKGLVSNKQMPFECLEALLSPEACPRHLRRMAVVSTERRDVLELLLCDPGITVSTRAKKKLHSGAPPA